MSELAKPNHQSTNALMKKLLVLACLAASTFAGKAAGQNTNSPAKPDNSPFLVFDNMAYAGKPDLSTNGLIPSCVIYYRSDWKKAIAAGRLPDENSFKEAVRSRSAGKPGPVVIDIEYVKPFQNSRHHRCPGATTFQTVHHAGQMGP